MAKQIQDMTPEEIDTILSDLWAKQQKVEHRIEGYLRTEADTFVVIEKIRNGVRLPQYRTVLDGIELVEQLDILKRNIAEYEAELAVLKAESLPYENEYVRRGGWSRYFLVTNDNGHVHRSMTCSTCNREGVATRFSWMIEFSGKDEHELTDQIGPNACTVCFPWAETIRVEFEAAERQRKTDERAAKAAEKARIAAEKGITTPEGDTLYTGKDNESYDVCKSLRTAEIAATDALVDLIDVQRQAKDPEFEWMFQNGRTEAKRTLEIARHAWCLIRSIAAKKGLTFQEVFETHDKKAQAKIRKQDREWAKNPRNPNRSK
jgi:hypothetical protein